MCPPLRLRATARGLRCSWIRVLRQKPLAHGLSAQSQSGLNVTFTPLKLSSQLNTSRKFYHILRLCRLSATMGRVKALFIGPGCPWENGYVEAFNGKLRDEFLSGEVFSTLAEAQILIEWWRREYNQEKPHRALGYHPLAPKNTSLQDSHFDWSSFRGEDQPPWWCWWIAETRIMIGLQGTVNQEAERKNG